ncbi:sodium-coupled monocarboxylate transporter 2-like [Mercenaria mercenaria]|uniref:sodium-coupled monocarboxylate transporter 2-like n=1 Tax=Mercenaria mercenaria TaxID=6596 RepID=UPI00234E612A|nr:sodium-coupled monocarboxylate transporter 2-like [Mercenaria mercenaria]
MKSKYLFGVADFAVFFAAVGVCLVIGVFFAIWERKRDTTINYFLANRNYRTLPVALSFVVTFQSSLSMLGFSAEAYVYGIGMAYCAVGILTAYSFTAIFIVPVIHPLKLTSVYGYFKLRYGNNVLRYMTLIAGIIYNLFYMAIITVGTCIAIEVVIRIPFWGTLLIYTILTSIYTSVGGIKAVIWTDVFQFVVIVSGIIAILVKSSTDAGGSARVFEYSRERFKTDFSFDPTIRFQFWNVSFGMFSSLLYVTLTQQAMQRVFLTPTVKTARTMYFICSPIFAIVTVMVTCQGATIFAYFVAKGCDILEAGLVKNVNAILPIAIRILFKHQAGLAGLFTAALSSAALSTLSSCLNGLSAVTYEDIIKVKFPELHTYQATRISKVIVLVYGLVTMGLAFAISHIPGSIASIFFSFMACMDGPICSVFLLSIFYRRATTKGLVTGAFCGMVISFWLNMGSKFSNVPPFPHLPAGPTNQCHKYSDQFLSYANNSENVNVTSFLAVNITNTPDFSTPMSSTIAVSNDASELTVLQRIYSISYILFSLIGLMTSLLIGIIVSLFTNPPKQFNERCLFSFRTHVIEEFCGNDLSKIEQTNSKAKNDEQELTHFLRKDDELQRK